MADNSETKQLIASFMEASSKGNVEEILDYLDEDASWWVGGNVEGVSGTYHKAAFGVLLSGLGAATKTGAIALKPIEWTIGERTAVETESYSELKSGRVYNNLYQFLFVARNGTIHAVREYLDTEHTRAIFLAPRGAE